MASFFCLESFGQCRGVMCGSFGVQPGVWRSGISWFQRWLSAMKAFSFLSGPMAMWLFSPVDVAQGTENGVEQMVSKAHQSASGRITMHQLCFALQSLFLQKRHAYTCIYIFGPASHRQEENRRSASWRISGASRRVTIHPRYHLFYTFFVSSSSWFVFFHGDGW